jgi:hypothetical protein
MAAGEGPGAGGAARGGCAVSKLWPPLSPDDVPETRKGDPKDPKSWHVGCMVTQDRAIMTARALFPHEVANGADCQKEVGREGLACRICAARNQAWIERVRQVRAAMMGAFS